MRTENKAFEGGLASRHQKSIKNNGLRRAKPSTGGLVRTTHVREIRLSLIIGGQRCRRIPKPWQCNVFVKLFYRQENLSYAFSFIESLLRRLTYHTEGVRRFLKSLNCTRCNILYKTFSYLEVCLYFVELILRSVTYHLGIHEQAHFRPWKCSKSS